MAPEINLRRADQSAVGYSGPSRRYSRRAAFCRMLVGLAVIGWGVHWLWALHLNTGASARPEDRAHLPEGSPILAKSPSNSDRSAQPGPEGHFTLGCRIGAMSIEGRARFLREVEAWVDRDCPATLGWAEQVDDGTTREVVLSQICYRLAETSPAEAVRIAARLRLGTNEEWVMKSLVGRWASVDLAGACEWAKDLADDEIRDKLFGRIAFAIAHKNPVEAARVVADCIAPGTVQDEAALTVLHQWPKSDLGGALAWVEGFPASDLKNRAISELEKMAGLKN